ncbi:MAG: hypothetical protein K2X27_23075 [Candidatus Obscuribacterales bacterium]|nr:hypothetical protein [Candidatus Obscuribacterales bacterium]
MKAKNKRNYPVNMRDSDIFTDLDTLEEESAARLERFCGGMLSNLNFGNVRSDGQIVLNIFGPSYAKPWTSVAVYDPIQHQQAVQEETLKQELDTAFSELPQSDLSQIQSIIAQDVKQLGSSLSATDINYTPNYYQGHFNGEYIEQKGSAGELLSGNGMNEFVQAVIADVENQTGFMSTNALPNNNSTPNYAVVKGFEINGEPSLVSHSIETHQHCQVNALAKELEEAYANVSPKLLAEIDKTISADAAAEYQLLSANDQTNPDESFGFHPEYTNLTVWLDTDSGEILTKSGKANFLAQTEAAIDKEYNVEPGKS